MKNIGQQFVYEIKTSPKELIDAEVLKNERQQKKIMAVIDTGDFEYLESKDVKLPAGRFDAVFKKIASGDIPKVFYQEFISEISGPIEMEKDKKNPEKMFKRADGDDKQIRGIIAELAYGKFKDRSKMGSFDLGVLYEKYPDPISFEDGIKEFIEMVREGSGDEKAEEYWSKAHQMALAVYGKKQEYWDQIKMLALKADNKNPDLVQDRKKKQFEQEIQKETDVQKLKSIFKKDIFKALVELKKEGYPINAEIVYTPYYSDKLKQNSNLNLIKNRIGELSGLVEFLSLVNLEEEVVSQIIGEDAQDEKSVKIEKLSQMKSEINEGKLSKLESVEVDEILSKAEVHGSELDGFVLSSELLKESGLQPESKLKIDNINISFSKPYAINAGRMAVMAYVQVDEEIVARSFYKSNSHNVWRYLPAFNYDEIQKEATLYSKGYGEDGVTLPLAFQKVLSHIDDTEILKIDNSENIFLSTARKKVFNPAATFFNVVQEDAQKLDGNFYAESGSREKIPPQELMFNNKEEKPNFDSIIDNWKRGEVAYEVYPSNNLELKYLFCMDGRGRVWIGGIENNSEITSVGLKESWVFGGDLLTPVDEYYDQTGGYGNSNMRNGDYVDMYENYLSQVPIIQEYLKAKMEKTHFKKENVQVVKLDFSNVQTDSDLYVELEKIETFEGSQQSYTKEELNNIIKAVLDEKMEIEYVPRKDGLRETVSDLLKIKRLRNQLRGF